MTLTELSTTDIDRYRLDGFVVLREHFDPAPLTAEVTAALADGFASIASMNVSAEADIAFRYLPMMSERTPISLELVRHFAALAERLVGRAALPVRAKAVEYHGSSAWHRDSELDLASVGFACYLQPLTATNGALQVLPGSHRHSRLADEQARVAIAAESVPGDVIVFDEHLLHSSSGGGVRHQWRVDYVAKPATAGDHDLLRRYFAVMFSPEWDGGYDVDAYPTYGSHWRRTCQLTDDALLHTSGAYAAAADEESAARRRRDAERDRPESTQRPTTPRSLPSTTSSTHRAPSR